MKLTENKNIVAIKESSGNWKNFYSTLTLTKAKIRVFCGPSSVFGFPATMALADGHSYNVEMMSSCSAYNHSAQMMGEACQVFFRDSNGKLHDQIIFRDQEAQLELISAGRKWSFEGNGAKFRLVSEADRIRLAYLFDPYVAVSSSSIDPLPHQISAVYEHMLPRQPMRFVLADDPGAG